MHLKDYCLDCLIFMVPILNQPILNYSGFSIPMCNSNYQHIIIHQNDNFTSPYRLTLSRYNLRYYCAALIQEVYNLLLLYVIMIA